MNRCCIVAGIVSLALTGCAAGSSHPDAGSLNATPGIDRSAVSTTPSTVSTSAHQPVPVDLYPVVTADFRAHRATYEAAARWVLLQRTASLAVALPARYSQLTPSGNAKVVGFGGLTAVFFDGGDRKLGHAGVLYYPSPLGPTEDTFVRAYRMDSNWWNGLLVTESNTSGIPS